MILFIIMILFVPLVINYFITAPIMKKMGHPVVQNNIGFMLPILNIFAAIGGLIAGFLLIILWILNKFMKKDRKRSDSNTKNDGK